MIITDHEMERRKLVLELRSAIHKLMAERVDADTGITYAEMLKVLHEIAGSLLGDMLADEWRGEDSSTGGAP